MPRVSVKTATATKAGLFARVRSVRRKSESMARAVQLTTRRTAPRWRGFFAAANRAPLFLPAAPAVRHSRRVVTLVLLAPLFLVFEVWQLVLCERYLGIKQIARGTDPRNLGLGEMRAFVWSAAIFVYWTWMLLLVVTPLGRMHGLGLLAVTMLAFTVRRGCPLKWVLVVLTFEGAVRVGVLLSLCGLVWLRMGGR
jgi:hypothetical protein